MTNQKKERLVLSEGGGDLILLSIFSPYRKL